MLQSGKTMCAPLCRGLMEAGFDKLNRQLFKKKHTHPELEWVNEKFGGVSFIWVH